MASLEKIAKLAEKGKGEKLLKFISNKDPEIRKAAYEGLKKTGGEKVVNTLTNILNDPDATKEEILNAINALSGCGIDSTFTLFSYLAGKEKDPEILEALNKGRAALRALGKDKI